jgi:hypothetical protein
LATEVAPKGRGGAAMSTYVDYDALTQVAVRPAGRADASAIADVIVASACSRNTTSPW